MISFFYNNIFFLSERSCKISVKSAPSDFSEISDFPFFAVCIPAKPAGAYYWPLIYYNLYRLSSNLLYSRLSGVNEVD